MDIRHTRIDAVSRLLLEMAQQRSLDCLFKVTVARLTDFSDIALARIWLVKDGDICDDCLLKAECNQQKSCLHLVASSGRSICDEGVNWNRIDGAHKRFPLGSRKVGYIAESGRSVYVESIAKDSRWIANKEWAEKEGVSGFVGQPLICKGQVLGVLAIFARQKLTPPVADMLRVVADHAASALANTTAFEEIKRLKKQLEQENACLREELSEVFSLGEIIGTSRFLQQVLNKIELVASTSANVLITGESGTGKELVAREIYHRSQRSTKPMIKVNCASISRELFASEFFGHTRGSFTGAVTTREGRFSAADGGTLFLDEIGEIPFEMQSKLLRVIQEGEYERVGEDVTRKVDVRIIAATNRDLAQEVKAGRFREDLYFRLNVFPIVVPPLRTRKEDIGPLADYFLKMYLRKMNRHDIELTSGHIAQLQSHDWPGNVRELQNIIERAVITSVSGPLHLDLPHHAISLTSSPATDQQAGQPAAKTVLSETEMNRLQIENTLAALQQCSWKIYGDDGAARLLGIKPTTLSTRIKAFGLKNPRL